MACVPFARGPGPMITGGIGPRCIDRAPPGRVGRWSSPGDTRNMLNIDLKGRRALVAGVADDGGFGFAIAKALAEAGASVCVGTWPPRSEARTSELPSPRNVVCR